MAEQCSLAVGKHSRDPSSLRAQLGVSNDIDLAVHQPQAPALETALNRALRKTQGDQLPLRDDPMLLLGERRDFPLSLNSLASPARACLTWTTHTGG